MLIIISLLAKAYHISDDAYNIATADRGANATIRVWTAEKLPQRPQVSGGFDRQ